MPFAASGWAQANLALQDRAYHAVKQGFVAHVLAREYLSVADEFVDTLWVVAVVIAADSQLSINQDEVLAVRDIRRASRCAMSRMRVTG